ncbi:hypothetical protein C0989_011773 [Termitomyces sp. Mn162]|nr:hypothetical protein C0989_011773 [Termitomyces sp. Mn162]
MLYDILPLLDSQAANDSLTVKAFFSFSNAIIQIENNCHEAQCQQELEAKQCCKHENHDVEMLGLSSTSQAISKESNAKLANPLKGESKDPMALLLAAAV